MEAAVRYMQEPTDEDELGRDVDDVELIDLRAPVRRSFADRPDLWRGRPRHLSIVELRLAAVHLGCDADVTFSTVVRGLLVGENPGANTHPDLPLFPWPERSSAGRLLEMSGLTAGQYLGGLYRRNLVDEPRWSRSAGAHRARSIVTALFEMPKGLRVVLCGSKVARAFGLRVEWWTPVRLDSRQTCVVVPHPSGLNRVYNDDSARARTGAWIRWAAIGEERPR